MTAEEIIVRRIRIVSSAMKRMNADERAHAKILISGMSVILTDVRAAAAGGACSKPIATLEAWEEIERRYKLGEGPTELVRAFSHFEISPFQISNRAFRGGWRRAGVPQRAPHPAEAKVVLAPVSAEPSPPAAAVEAVQAGEDTILLWWEEQLERDGASVQEAIDGARGPLDPTLLLTVNTRRIALCLSPFAWDRS